MEADLRGAIRAETLFFKTEDCRPAGNSATYWQPFDFDPVGMTRCVVGIIPEGHNEPSTRKNFSEGKISESMACAVVEPDPV